MARKKSQPTKEQILAAVDDDELALHLLLRNDPVAFCRHVCGIDPHKAQVQFLTANLELLRTLLAWARRFGKSKIVAVYLAWCLFAVAGYNAYVFAPSGEQSSVVVDYIQEIYETSPYLQRYTNFRRKGNKFSVGDSKWRSSVELVKTGLTGDNARGQGVQGGKGLIVFDEVNSFLYANEVTEAIKPFVSPGGGIIYLGSPGDVGSWWHQTHQDWKARQAEGSKRHLVIDCTYKDVEHIDRDFVEEERREAVAKNRLWVWEREYLGKFTVPQGSFFSRDDVESCQVHGEQNCGGKGDVWIYSLDPGLDKSPSVLLVARWNQLLSRLEITDCLSFVRFTNKHVNDDGGHDKIEAYEEIVDKILDLRKSKPIHTFYVDPGCEKNIGERLKNSFNVNVVDCRIGGYAAKLAALRDLQRSLGDNKIVWQDHRITRQLLEFAPPTNRQTGRYEFPDKNYDIIAALTQLNRYIGDRIVTPYAVSVGARKVSALW